MPSKRHVADWGGDDVFASPNRRRFDREPEAGAAREPAEDVWERAALAVAEEHDRPAEPRAAQTQPDRPHSGITAQTDRPHSGESFGPPAAKHTRASAQGRRTVTITGRPGDRTYDLARRPSRTLDERIAHAPERIAGWAFGLGLLLIIIAIATSH